MIPRRGGLHSCEEKLTPPHCAGELFIQNGGLLTDNPALAWTPIYFYLLGLSPPGPSWLNGLRSIYSSESKQTVVYWLVSTIMLNSSKPSLFRHCKKGELFPLVGMGAWLFPLIRKKRINKAKGIMVHTFGRRNRTRGR